MYPTYNAPVPGTPADAQHTMARYNRTPYSVQWNAGVQRQLANNLMLEVEYVGDGGRHMPLFTNENDPLPGPGTVGQPGHFRPYQYADPNFGTYPTSGGFGADSMMDNVATSAYNSLQVKIEKKFSNGLQFLASYAWGHYIDEGGSGFSQSSAPQIDNNFAADRGDGTFDGNPIHENKQSVQFRAEFFNAFNHVNLGGIDGTIEDTTFGSIGGTQNDSREIQFALKLYF